MMGLKIGSTDTTAFYAGTTAITKVYIGSTQLWPSVPAPMMYYDFHEQSGTRASDVMGTFSQLAGSSWEGGGVSDQFQWNTSSDQFISNTNNWTVMFDIELDAISYLYFIQASSSGGNQYFYMNSSDQKFSLYTNQSGNVVGTTTLQTGQSYRLAVTSDGNTIYLYVNGTREATKTATVPPFNTNGGLFHRGSPSWDGRMDNLRVWDILLSDGQVASLST